jgi:hypothetical protein
LSAFIMTALLALLALGLSFSYFPAAAYAAPSPHLGGVGDASCKSCHVPHRATTARSMMKGGNEGAEGEVPTCFLCHDGTAAVSNVKTGPDSFAGVSGHALEDATTPEEAVDLTNACSSCHKPHGDYATNPKLPAPLINGAAVTAAGTVWCLACHNDEQDWYDAIGVYPALDTPSRDATGYPVVGTYPGATVYLDETANPHAKIPAQAEPTARVAGDCLYCHSAHRGPNGYDGLNATFRPSKTETAASDRTDGTYAAACFQCHDGSRADATNIKQFVTHEAADETLMASSGHRIKTSGGTLPVNSPLPCYDCHNPHGSSRGNAKLLSDERGENLDTGTTDAGVRQFCLTCHVTFEVTGWDSETSAYVPLAASSEKIEGLLRNGGTLGDGPGGGYNWLRLKETVGHHEADAQSCYECHGGDYAAADSKNVHDPGSYSVALHTVTPPDAAIDILGVTYPAQVCATCHSLELGPEHAKSTSSSTEEACAACHPTPRSSLTAAWENDTCAEGDCHTTGSTAPMHDQADTGHTPLGSGPAAACAAPGCHDDSGGLAQIHDDGVPATDDCARCHADGVPETKDCTVCHPGNPHPDADHTVSGPCIASNCHDIDAAPADGSTDAAAVHNSLGEAGPGCSACHGAGKTPSFACRECHEPPHADANHENAPAGYIGTDICYSCHSTGNLMTVHDDNCLKCHAAGATLTWDGTCSAVGCHPNYHASIPDPQGGGHPYDHGDGDDCWGCHDQSWFDECEGCHTWWYERAKPVTTSDARATYTGSAFIRLTAVDYGEGYDTVGVRGTYYQVDGGPIQTGTIIVIAGPAEGTEKHGIEFWSTDNYGNTESPHKFAHFTITAGAPDTNAPAGTMSINSGATYTNSVNVTVNSAVADAETGVVDMRVDPGTGTYGAWVPYSAAAAATMPGGNGTKTLRAQYRDVAGNTLTLTDTIILDATLPTGTMNVNNNAAYTNTLAVTINSNVSDALSGVVDMRYAAGTGWSAWVPYSTSLAATMYSGSQGMRGVSAQYRDAAGNILELSDGITYDNAAPTGTMSVNNNAATTTSAAVTLNSAMSDPYSNVAQMRVDPGTGTFGGWIAYSASYAFTLPAGDGTKTVRAEYQDGAGNVASKTDTIVLNTSGDVTPPTGTVTINGGAAWTNSNMMQTLTLSATDAGTGVAAMQFSNDNVNWSGWQTYATSWTWSLSAGAGTKTVYAQFRDGAGNVSSTTISDSIQLETTAPTGSVTINSGAAWTNDTTCTLTLVANDLGGSGLSQMRFSNDNSSWSAWEAIGSSKTWSLTAVPGTKTVWVQYRDVAGNVNSASITDTIGLEVTAPAGSITIAGGAAWTTTTSVTLTLSASDPGGSGVSQMAFSNDGVTWSGWEAYAATKSWTLSAVAGNKTVAVRFRDVAGNVGTYSDSIGLDADAPIGTMVVNHDDANTTSTSVEVDSAVSDMVSGISQMRVDSGTGTYGAWTAYSAAVAITLPPGDGVKTVRAEYRDAAGNVLALTDTILLSVFGGTGPQTYNATGADQYYTVPAGVLSLTIDAYGAQGGDSDSGIGGRGGYVQAVVPVTPGQVLTIRVGNAASGGTGGWPNGGDGDGGCGAGGGGSSSVLYGTTIWAEAGGGGGADHDPVDGGDGGVQGWLPGGNESGESGSAGGGGGWNGGAANPVGNEHNGSGDGGTSYIAAGSGTLTPGLRTGNGQIVITPGPVQTGTITFSWDAPTWGGPWADYYIYDVNNNLIHSAFSSEIPGWDGWYTATVPVDPRGYTWYTEWYDPGYGDGTTSGSAMIDYPGKGELYPY